MADIEAERLAQRAARSETWTFWSKVALITLPFVVMFVGGLVASQVKHYDDEIAGLKASYASIHERDEARARNSQLQADIEQTLTTTTGKLGDNLERILNTLQDLRLQLAHDETRLACLENKTICKPKD